VEPLNVSNCLLGQASERWKETFEKSWVLILLSHLWQQLSCIWDYQAYFKIYHHLLVITFCFLNGSPFLTKLFFFLNLISVILFITDWKLLVSKLKFEWHGRKIVGNSMLDAWKLWSGFKIHLLSINCSHQHASKTR